MSDLTICFVLDKSGSMASIADDTIGGFNAFKRAQAAEPGRTRLSLTLFDGSVHPAHAPIPVDDVPDLTRAGYVPCGSTALYDAVGAAIETAQQAKPDGAVLVAVLTDGQENASTMFSKTSLASLIAAKKLAGWDFMYLGATPENWADAAALGVSSVAFAPTPAGMHAAYASVAERARTTRGS